MSLIEKIKNNKAKIFIAAVLLAISGTIIGISANFANADTTAATNDEATHYLAFTSDVHGQNDKLATAFKNMPETVEYVGLIGDMVGAGGGQHPEYNSSDLLTIAKNAFPNLDSTKAAIVWADHDISVHDDADIVKIWHGFEDPNNGYDSKEIAKTADYYLYVIGYYHMLKGGDVSKTAAADFKAWIDTIDDKTKPIIVLGHVPLAAKRGDNNGATYWNEALNYAATGIEGLNEKDTTAEVTRNVFYFYGHNHTVDATEYYYAPGGIMNIQIDTTTADAALLGSITPVLATDDELGVVAAQGIDTKVYYNALITGYIKTSGNATLMIIDKDNITLTKYNDGSKVSLGTDGSTGAILADTVIIPRIKSQNSDEVIPKAPDTGRQ